VERGPEPDETAVGDGAERTEREQRSERCDERGVPVAGARGHPDRGDEPERGCGREPAHREALPDDGAGPEEADPGHDLRRDPRRVDPDAPVAEAVGRDEREERRADADDEVRAQSRLPLAQLAFEPDGAA